MRLWSSILEVNNASKPYSFNEGKPSGSQPLIFQDVYSLSLMCVNYSLSTPQVSYVVSITFELHFQAQYLGKGMVHFT